jgi:predicted metal-dependent hydrolase
MTIETTPDVVTWESTDIPYRYYCSRRRRTLGISVHRDLSVVVRAPCRTSREVIRAFVGEHAAWIIRTQKKIAQKPDSLPLIYRNGEIHRYGGRPYHLEVRQGHTDSVACVTDRLVVTMQREPSEESTKKLLHAWYRARADILFNDRLLVCHQRAASEGIPLPTLTIRKMRSRWGSYSFRGRVTLNLWLILAPVECLDYVILHELCHYKVRRHGPQFWRLLTRLVPDCRLRRKELDAYVAGLNVI